MKKFFAFVLFLVCVVAVAACSHSNVATTTESASVYVADREITVYVGGTYQFVPSGAESFSYVSSDEEVAKVSQNGLLTGISDGTAFIDVSSDASSVTCKVNVITAENYIRLSADRLTVAMGSDITLTAEVVKNGKTTDEIVKFDYDLEEKFVVKPSGFNTVKISLKDTGNYKVSVTYGSLKAVCIVKSVNVAAEVLESPLASVVDCGIVQWEPIENASGYEYCINGGEWIETTETSFDVHSVTDVLKYKDKAVLAVRAVTGENDFDYIDSLPVSIDFSHDYKETVLEEYTCTKAGITEYKCAACGKEYTDEMHLADHVMVDGACTVCGLQQTKKVVYRYDENNDCYFVVGADAGYDDTDLYILAKYNDGKNGERAVKYIGYGAFQSNKTIRKAILPESMTEFVDADAKFNKTDKNGVMVSSPLRGACFDDCSELEYVSMKGITVLRDVADASYAHWNFRDCYNLKQVIVGNGFNNYGATFMRWTQTPDNAENQIDIYVYGDNVVGLCNDSYPIGYDAGYGNNTLLTGDVFYYSEESENCYQWHYASDGETIVSGGKHVYNAKNKCKKCGAMNDYGVKYEFDGSSYYVSDNRTLNQKEVVILDTYTDGIHGERPVTFVKNSAFAGNVVLRKITLPKSVIRLDGSVFANCGNLEYVSMTGITDMVFVSLSDKGIYQGIQDIDTGNNFLDCYKLGTLIVNEKFNLYAAAESQQFLGRDRLDQNNKVIKAVPCVDIYSIGSFADSDIKAAPNGKNNLLTGIVFYKGDLDKCRRWQQDEDGIIESSAREHNYVDGICSNCGEKDAMGVIYGYNAAKGVYYVAGYNGSGENVTVFSTWDDGKNGEKPVKYLAAAAFKDNTTIKKVILPASVDSLEGSVFWGCENLEYVSMTGITNLEYASPYGGAGRNNNFRNCFKLSVVITSNALSSNVGQFGCGATDTSNKKILDFYVDGESGAPSLDYETADANNLCSGKVFYKGDATKCLQWNFDENGEIIHGAAEHNYKDGVCGDCGDVQSKTVTYAYDSANACYYVTGVSSQTERELYIRPTYNDGTNGEHAVKYLAANAFKDNTTIKKVILPASVDSLEGSVFWGCENLEYVSMTGITNLEYASPYGGAGRNNNFRNCFKLSVVITSNALSSNVGQFGCGATDTSNKKILDFYVDGESGAPSLDYETPDANNLCSGNVYYYSETEKSGCWHYVNGVATLWA